jgi:hypothetical protein
MAMPRSRDSDLSFNVGRLCPLTVIVITGTQPYQPSTVQYRDGRNDTH